MGGIYLLQFGGDSASPNFYGLRCAGTASNVVVSEFDYATQMEFLHGPLYDSIEKPTLLELSESLGGGRSHRLLLHMTSSWIFEPADLVRLAQSPNSVRVVFASTMGQSSPLGIFGGSSYRTLRLQENGESG